MSRTTALLSLLAMGTPLAASAQEPAATNPARAAPAASASTSAPASAPAATPPASAASAPEAEPDAPALPQRVEETLQSWEDFLNGLLVNALGERPERRYRVDGKRKTVDLGRRWTLSLDERAIGLIDSAGVGIPAAGQPSRTWELQHQGRTNDLLLYNRKDGTGRINGGQLMTRLNDDWAVHTEGLRLHDDDSGMRRSDLRSGLRYNPLPEWWVEGFVRGAELNDPELRQTWAEPRPRAAFGGLQAQWDLTPGLALSAQHQRAIRPNLAAGDERLADARTEFGADYRVQRWPGTRLYWREATQLGLLASDGLDERSTYKRTFGVEAPEGSPDGLVYGQIRQRTLLDDRDTLLVVGWRHSMELAPKWTAQSLIESGIPIRGDNAQRSTTVDLRVGNDEFPHHALLTEVQAVRTPIKNTAFASVDYTRRVTSNSLAVWRASATGTRPHDDPTVVPVNSGQASVGWGWQEPEERRFSTFWRYTLLGRSALLDGVVTPGVADRRAQIGYSEFSWQSAPAWNLLLRASRRWDRDDSFQAGTLHTTSLVVPRVTHQLAERWRFSVHGARLTDNALPAQRGWGTELSVQLNRKVVLALGYNPRGVNDGELAGDDRLDKGVRLRLYIPVEATLTHWLKPR